jgi:hypothetical protein
MKRKEPRRAPDAGRLASHKNVDWQPNLASLLALWANLATSHNLLAVQFASLRLEHNELAVNNTTNRLAIGESEGVHRSTLLRFTSPG